VVNARRARLAITDGHLSKAAQCLLSQGLAPPSEEVLQSMKDKHPQANPPALPFGPVSSPTPIEMGVLVRAMKSFPSSSAPGPSGLRPTHLREAALCQCFSARNRACLALLAFVRMLASGRAPPNITPLLCGASLLACQKKGGGLRPIAVGEVLRRLTSKCLAFTVNPAAAQLLAPVQVGVGVRGGCEAVVHALGRTLRDPSHDPDNRWVLLVDFANAFNSVSRECMFTQTRTEVPGISAWLEACYSNPPMLRFGRTTIQSCQGVQQGDPLGPLAFSLALRPLTEAIQRVAPNLLLHAWYLDDGTLCGSPAELHRAWEVIEQLGPSLGLSLNHKKSQLFVPEGANVSANPFPSDVPVLREGFTLLGAPYGPSHYCEEVVSTRVGKIKDLVARLPDLQDSHMATSLLRSCLAFPKIAFSLRSCAPGLIPNGLRAFDCTIRWALSEIVGSPISDWSWSKAGLSPSSGGVGLRSAALHAPTAYIGSVHQTAALVGSMVFPGTPEDTFVPEVVRDLAEVTGHPEWSTLDSITLNLSQRTLSAEVDTAQHERLLLSAPSLRHKALLLSTGLPYAGAWLSALPSPALGLHIHTTDFRVCLKYWLGLPLSSVDEVCPSCTRVADRYGDHHVGCDGDADRLFRHNALRDALFSAASSAALAPRKELPNLVAGSQSRPADIFLPVWTNGRGAALDVTVVCPLQKKLVARAAVNPGHALTYSRERKNQKHRAECQGAGIDFIPIVVEALGGWDTVSAVCIQRIARAQGARLGLPSHEAVPRLFQRLSVTLWRANATMWGRRMGVLPPEVDGVE